MDFMCAPGSPLSGQPGRSGCRGDVSALSLVSGLRQQYPQPHRGQILILRFGNIQLLSGNHLLGSQFFPPTPRALA